MFLRVHSSGAEFAGRKHHKEQRMPKTLVEHYNNGEIPVTPLLRMQGEIAQLPDGSALLAALVAGAGAYKDMSDRRTFKVRHMSPGRWTVYGSWSRLPAAEKAAPS